MLAVGTAVTTWSQTCSRVVRWMGSGSRKELLKTAKEAPSGDAFLTWTHRVVCKEPTWPIQANPHLTSRDAVKDQRDLRGM